MSAILRVMHAVVTHMYFFRFLITYNKAISLTYFVYEQISELYLIYMQFTGTMQHLARFHTVMRSRVIHLNSTTLRVRFCDAPDTNYTFCIWKLIVTLRLRPVVTLKCLMSLIEQQFFFHYASPLESF